MFKEIPSIIDFSEADTGRLLMYSIALNQFRVLADDFVWIGSIESLLVNILMFSLGALCRKNKVFFHTDAAQAVGKIPMDVNELNIDLMSISGHKIYGPKGVFRKTLCQFSCLINMAQNFYDTFFYSFILRRG